MPHKLFLGMTESGKTTLATKLAAGFKSRGISVAVLDPMKDERWQADFLTDDPAAFLHYCKRNKNHALFIDESSATIGRYNQPMEWLVTQSRHWGHSAHVLTQGWTQLPPIVRDQCSQVFLFASSNDAAKKLADKFNEPALLGLEKFRPGQFYIVSRFADMQIGQIDFATGKVSIGKSKASGKNAA